MEEMKLREIKEQKRLVTRGIEFDWIFNKKEGYDFLKSLS